MSEARQQQQTPAAVPQCQGPAEAQAGGGGAGAGAAADAALTRRPEDYPALQQYGDATRDIVVAVEKKLHGIQRKSSWAGFPTRALTSTDIAQPGGFRRHFIASKQPPPDDQAGDGDGGIPPLTPGATHTTTYTSFVDELLQTYDIFGCGYDRDDPGGGWKSLAAEPLLGIEPMIPQVRQGLNSPELRPVGGMGRAPAPKGEANAGRLVFMIAKCFIGSAVLILPRMMRNGGLLLGGATLIFCCGISIMGVRMLLDCAELWMAARGNSRVPSYPELVWGTLGATGFRAVTTSLVLSQLSFCACYVIFIEQNFRHVLGAASQCRVLLSAAAVTACCTVLLVPLTWVRRMRYFAYTNLLAMFCTVLGLLIVLGVMAGRLIAGVAPREPVRLVALENYALALGTALFTFEGIGCVLPIYQNTAPALRPRFKGLLTMTIVGMLLFMLIFAATCYAALGGGTMTLVLLNLPSDSPAVWVVQCVYSVALFFSYPLQFYPVSSILESWLVPRSGKSDVRAKHLKNGLRAGLVVSCSLAAFACQSQLDNFVALVGGLCSVPLAIIFPALLHLRIGKGGKAGDSAMVATGLGLMLFATGQAIATWGTADSHPYHCVAGAPSA